MLCEKCGSQIDDEAKFCSHCGAVINAEPKNDFVTSDTSAPSEKTKSRASDITDVIQTDNRQRKHTFALFSLWGVCFLLLFFGWFRPYSLFYSNSFSIFSIKYLFAYVFGAYSFSVSAFFELFYYIIIWVILAFISAIMFFKCSNDKSSRRNTYITFIATSSVSVYIPIHILSTIASRVKEQYSIHSEPLTTVYGNVFSLTISPYIFITLSIIALLISIYSFRTFTSEE